MSADRPNLTGWMPPREGQKRLVTDAQTARIRPQREVDPRTDLPDRSPKTKTIPATDADFFSPMG